MNILKFSTNKISRTTKINILRRNVFDEFEQFENTTVHIRLKQRSAKSSITIIENLSIDDDFLKTIKKKLGCNGCVKSTSSGKYIQLSGDQRNKVKNYLLENNICDEIDVMIHGV